MGHSSLIHVERADAEPAGRDTAALGPSDSSDSGSDLVGIDALDVNDPNLPVDVALREDVQRSHMPPDGMRGAGGSDAAGTGERRAAAGDASLREAQDISTDRVFDPLAPDEELDDDEDPDLAFTDQLAETPAADDDAAGEEAVGAEPAGDPDAEADAREQVLGALVDDHTRVKSAYEAFLELDPRADGGRREAIVDQVLFELQLHAALEEELLYPAARAMLDDEQLIDQAEVEHESMHALIGQLTAMDAGDEKFDARFTVLCEYVLHHVKEEEGKLFPRLRRVVLEWGAMAAAMDERREALAALADDDREPAAHGSGERPDDDHRFAAYDAAVERDDARHPDEQAPEPRRDQPATGIASHGSATSRKI